MRRRDLIAAGVAALTTTACNGQQTWTLKYKLRIRVFANGRSCESENFFRSTYWRVPSTSLNQTRTFHAQAWGEAVAIDVGRGQWIFALLDTVSGVGADHRFSPLDERLITQTIPDAPPEASAFSSGELYDMALRMQGEQDLPRRSWPLFARFENLTDLASVQPLRIEGERYRPSPGIPPLQSFEAAYGRGARIEKITVEMTNQNPTQRLGRLLPWLAEIQGANRTDTVRGPRLGTLYQNLQHRNFVMDGDVR